MSSLRSCVTQEAEELRDGIHWVVFWKQGRSWFSAYFCPFLDDDETFEFELDDLESMQDIVMRDPNAVMLNGYYCGYLGEDMTISQLEQGVRWHYENGCNLLSEWTEIQEDEEPKIEESVIENTETVIETTETVSKPNQTVSVTTKNENNATYMKHLSEPKLAKRRTENRCRDG